MGKLLLLCLRVNMISKDLEFVAWTKFALSIHVHTKFHLQAVPPTHTLIKLATHTIQQFVCMDILVLGTTYLYTVKYVQGLIIWTKETLKQLLLNLTELQRCT